MGLRDLLRGRRTPEDAFTGEISTLIRELLPVQRIDAAPQFSLVITFVDGRTTTMHLGTIFVESNRLDGAARTERLRRAVLAMMPSERPATWGEAQGRLFPAVRAISWAAAAGGADAQPLWRPFLPYLVLLTALDEEHGMSFVTRTDLRRWGVDHETVEATARANLTSAGMPAGRSGASRRVDVLGPDGYVASWLAAGDALEQLSENAALGDCVVLAPSRDVLRVVPTSDRAALRSELEQALADYQAEPRQLSPVPYRVEGGRVEPWAPPPGDPCEATVERSARVLAAVEYGLQQHVLNDLFEKTGEDVFVAQYNLMERPDGTVWSWAAWVRQVTAGLLPRADYVAVGDTEAKTTFWVRWDDAERIAPRALRREGGYYPPRWRVSGWPDEPELRELRAAAVDAAGG